MPSGTPVSARRQRKQHCEGLQNPSQNRRDMKEVIRVLMESAVYWHLCVVERLLLVKECMRDMEG